MSGHSRQFLQPSKPFESGKGSRFPYPSQRPGSADSSPVWNAANTLKICFPLQSNNHFRTRAPRVAPGKAQGKPWGAWGAQGASAPPWGCPGDHLETSKTPPGEQQRPPSIVQRLQSVPKDARGSAKYGKTTQKCLTIWEIAKNASQNESTPPFYISPRN